MELTATNRSQAYPNAEKEISKQSVGLKKSKKDLQLSDECSIILYVVLKVCKMRHRSDPVSFFVKNAT